MSVHGSLVSLAAFLAGAVIAGRLDTTLQSCSAASRLRLTLGLEVALLATATVVAFTVGHAIDALAAGRH